MNCRFFHQISLPASPDFFVVHNEENKGLYLDVKKFDVLNTRMFDEPPSNLVVPYFFPRGIYVVVLSCKTTIEALKQLESFEARSGFCAFRGFSSVLNWNTKVMREEQPLLSLIWDEGLTTDFYAESDEQIVS